MFVNNPEIDEILEFTDCIASMPDPESCPKSLLDAKSNAFLDAWERARSYRRHGMRNDLVHIAFKKRMGLISNASTVTEVREILKEPRPHFDGNEFFCGPYSVPEEEMMMWSLASLKAPPSEAAFERYMSLFTQIFGFDPSDPDCRMMDIKLEVEDEEVTNKN